MQLSGGGAGNVWQVHEWSYVSVEIETFERYLPRIEDQTPWFSR